MIVDLKLGSHKRPNINECAEPGKHTDIEKTELRKTGNKSQPSTKSYWQADSCPCSQCLGLCRYIQLMRPRLPAWRAFEPNDGEEHLASEV